MIAHKVTKPQNLHERDGSARRKRRPSEHPLSAPEILDWWNRIERALALKGISRPDLLNSLNTRFGDPEPWQADRLDNCITQKFRRNGSPRPLRPDDAYEITVTLAGMPPTTTATAAEISEGQALLAGILDPRSGPEWFKTLLARRTPAVHLPALEIDALVQWLDRHAIRDAASSKKTRTLVLTAISKALRQGARSMGHAWRQSIAGPFVRDFEGDALEIVRKLDDLLPIEGRDA